jgi:hypothetical protein
MNRSVPKTALSMRRYPALQPYENQPPRVCYEFWRRTGGFISRWEKIRPTLGMFNRLVESLHFLRSAACIIDTSASPDHLISQSQDARRGGGCPCRRRQDNDCVRQACSHGTGTSGRNLAFICSAKHSDEVFSRDSRLKSIRGSVYSIRSESIRFLALPRASTVREILITFSTAVRTPIGFDNRSWNPATKLS